MKITFCGAARTVTGSCYLLDIGGEQSLVDCGMFQGPKDITRLNYEDFNFEPEDISRVFLTHAHIDHCGLLPKLVEKGFNGDIYATPATIDLAKIMLEDSAHTQETETEQENRRRAREGLEPRSPLYTREDVKECFPLFKKVSYCQMVKVSDSISVRYQDAGHILGSAFIEMFINDGGKAKKIVFSGDIGQWENPIINDPTLIEEADYVLIESTYGDKLHEGNKDKEKLLLQCVRDAYKKGGKLMIPAFAVDRTQELLYDIHKMKRAGVFPNEKVYLDSPLGMKATQVFEKHRECYDQEALKEANPFEFKDLVYTPRAEDSAKLNNMNQPCVIIAGSGMCTGGRIRHHFKHGLWNKKNTVLFVGFQAEGTLGRYIVEGSKRVKMMGMEVVVNADIRKIDGFSAHADYQGLLKWISGFKTNPRVFVVHGEPLASESFKEKLERKGLDAYVPYFGETIEL